MISDPALTPETREDLAGIIAATDRLERWTRSLLSYLHPMKPNFSRIELRGVLDNVFDLCRLRIEEKNLTVVRDDGEAGLIVSLDVELMEQALQGLIVNAIEASPDGEQLTLRVASSHSRVSIYVLDHGPGMPLVRGATDLAPGPTTKRFGAGLGIPFALRVIEEHGGAIEFRSRQPVGAEVIVVIPKHQVGEGSVDVNE